MKFVAIFALVSAAAAIHLTGKPAKKDSSGVPPDPAHNPTVWDRTGVYSPKPNMYTGYEGPGAGH